MATVIQKDEEWLRKQIESGIQGFLELNIDRICSTVAEKIYAQIYLTGCEINSESPADDPAELIIRIGIPKPEECVKEICGLGK